MESILAELEFRVRQALVNCFGDGCRDVEPQVRLSQDERFGDYQSNCAMGLGKKLGKKPRELAREIVDGLDVAELCEPPDIAGPGFINFRLKPSAIAARLQSIPPAPREGVDRMGVKTATEPITVVVDMSSPNLAKEMHVGHLRSTILGDCVARILEFKGHQVHRINHVGDWGTQFGMLVTHLRNTRPEVLGNLDQLRLPDLESFYVSAKAEFDRDPGFAAQARKAVTQLQGGDPETLRIWKAFCDESLRHCGAIYDRLDVRIENCGESFYNDLLPGVVEELLSKGLATISEGAVCVFLDGFVNREGNPLPMIVRKSDGGYNYATTDLTALKYRVEQLGARRIVYVVGVTQKQHLQMLFAAGRKAGWAPANVLTEHLAFGSVLGPDGRPFKTREGGTVKLKDLLDEAVFRARQVVESNEDDKAKARGLNEADRQRVAETVGMAAVRYFDLSHNLASDYKFNFDHMLAMEGNTAPYMLYAYARIRSIGRKAGVDYADIPADTPITLEHESELKLAKVLVRFPEVVSTVAGELHPNILTEYLYETSKAFSLFYDRVHGVRVIDAPPPARMSRLRLCDLAARTLRLGLGLLGIRTLEQM
ncbi:MAG: arginine--tRNA ligase [Phycisphaerae bacterium]|nr:arginine--tRNA ligase [Phycisphaerae bacterium]